MLHVCMLGLERLQLWYSEAVGILVVETFGYRGGGIKRSGETMARYEFESASGHLSEYIPRLAWLALLGEVRLLSSSSKTSLSLVG